MANIDWDQAGFTDTFSRLGKYIDTRSLIVPGTVELAADSNSIRWDWHPEPRPVQPRPRMFGEFFRLWKLKPEAVAKYARRWGVLWLDDRGRPCAEQHVFLRGRTISGVESISQWQYLSRRVYSVLNIASALDKGELGNQEDWEVLSLLSRSEEETKLGLPFYGERDWFTGTGGLERGVELVSSEVSRWLALGRVGLQVTARHRRDPQDYGVRWGLEVDCKSLLLAVIAIQLALTVARADKLFTCSECGIPYLREKRRPKRGQSNFCEAEDCGRKAALRQADKRRRRKEALPAF